MNYDDLYEKIFNFIIRNNNQPQMILYDCYYNSNKDLCKISRSIKQRFNLDKDYNDIMESYWNDYFIFKLKDIYIVLNVQIYNKIIEFKVIKEKDRNKALIYRYI
jgi:hypothetical protein